MDDVLWQIVKRKDHNNKSPKIIERVMKIDIFRQVATHVRAHTPQSKYIISFFFRHFSSFNASFSFIND